jgi:hypothetical protein
VRNVAPLADQSRYALAMSGTRRFRNPLDIRVGGRSKTDCRLVIGRGVAGIEHDARIGQRQDDRVTVTDDVGAEHRLVEVPGSFLVGDDQELRDEQLAGRRRGVVHHLSP